MRRLKVVICTFLFVVSLATMLGQDLRPIHADETTTDTNQLGFIIDTVDRQGVTGSTSIAVDSNGLPHISYFKAVYADGWVSDELRYARFNGSSWIIETVDKNVTDNGAACSLALDSNGYPHISYSFLVSIGWTYLNYLKYACFDGNSWIIQSVDAGLGRSFSIAIDSRNNPHISYTEDQSHTLRYAYYNGSSWTKQIIASYGSLALGSMSLDSSDNPHIAYSERVDSESQPLLRYACYNGTAWNIETVDSQIGYDVSIVLDSHNNPHISYRSAPKGLKYAYFDGSSWNIQLVPSSEGDDVYENSIALDSKGNPHISYATHTLRYAYNNGVSWNVKTVDYEGGGAGMENSIALDSHEYVHISYQYADPSGFRIADLRYARSGVPANVKLGSTLSISLSSSTSYVGFKVEIKGNFTDVGFRIETNGSLSFNWVGISEAPILLSYSVTGGESWNDITLVNTASDGRYSAVWMPSATGNYLVRAMWYGEAAEYGITAILKLAVTPFEEKNVFAVTSDSTVSELAFNSTSRELSFTVTGPSGTTGYVNVYIAKTLVGNIADVKVYLDGEQLDYTATSTDDSWLLHFTYTHSTHTISISLGPTPFIPPQLITPLSIGILGAALVVATVLIIRRTRKGTPPTILDGVLRRLRRALAFRVS